MPYCKRFRWTACWILLVCFGGVSVEHPCPAQEVLSPVKVMSFNIRFGTANDGDNHWLKRRDLVVETIQISAPDLLGVQESLKFQHEFIGERVPGYTFVGRGREKEPEAGEFCGIFFRNDRFELVEDGHFWLSENPDEPGSRSWDSSLPRMVSWVRLKDRSSGNRELVFANTHFDHRGPLAREKSAMVIQRQLLDRHEGLPIVLCGDFNTGEGTAPYKALVSPATDVRTKPLIDSFRAFNPQPGEGEGTFGGWQDQRTGARIDWILQTGNWKTLDARINRLNDGGRFPSDHFPVEAVLRMRVEK